MIKRIQYFYIIVIILTITLCLATRSQPCFIINEGQWDAEILYLAKLPDFYAWLTKDGVIYEYFKVRSNNHYERKIIKMSYIARCQTLTNCLTSKEDKSSLPPFEKGSNEVRCQTLTKCLTSKEVIIDNIQPGISVRWYFEDTPQPSFERVENEEEIPQPPLFKGGNEVRCMTSKHSTKTKYSLRYDFIVHPGADISKIKMKFEGQERIYINEKGDIVIQTSEGEIHNSKLYAYQINIPHPLPLSTGEGNTSYSLNSKEWAGGGSVPCNFLIYDDGSVGFKVENYNPELTLVIDPIVWSTFIGGNDYDYSNSIFVDKYNEVTVAGYTFSATYPTSTGAYNVKNSGITDIFASKLNSTGSSLLYSTFIGGDSRDDGLAMTVNNSGSIYITGYTQSSNFPITASGYDNSLNGYTDVFSVKLNPGGSFLLYSTFIGGDNIDEGLRISTDNSDNASITGQAWSNNYPVTSGAYNMAFSGNCDVFVSKLNPAGSSLLYSTYIGGDDYEEGTVLTKDSKGNTYISGNTYSDNFPATSGVYDESYN
ncbi:MAG: hypothetical protein QG635_703, partial [Bacteroidota bacterium]|nr:hypothetical protein [Bacteroidota bacterium]